MSGIRSFKKSKDLNASTNYNSSVVSGKSLNNNSSLNNAVGINTTSIVNDYATRVGATVTETGKSQIQSFLNNIISNNIPLPDYLYAMRNYQNKGSGNTLYDLYCSRQDANPISVTLWDSNGISSTDINNPIALVPNVFPANTSSTMIAVNKYPVFNGNWKGVFGYTGPNFNTFGYTNYIGQIQIQSGWNGGYFFSIASNTSKYDFWGFSNNGTNLNLKYNNQKIFSAASAAMGSGGWLLGKYINAGINFTLNDYMSFATAWSSQALSLAQMENVRLSYFSTLGTSFGTN